MKKITVEFYFYPDGMPVEELHVVGSWDDEGDFHGDWVCRGTPMKRTKDGGYRARVSLRCEPRQWFWWGVKDNCENWMLFEQEAIRFLPKQQRKQRFTLGYRHTLGVHRAGRDGFRAAVWAPYAREVSLVVYEGEEALRAFTMERGELFWEIREKAGWKEIQGHPYGFEMVTSCGQRLLRADPYARVRQGPQRGVSDLFLNSAGQFAHRYNVGENGFHFLRFEAVPAGRRTPVLRLFREGKQLIRDELSKLCLEKAALPKGEAWWTSGAEENGDIKLSKAPGAEAYSICIGPEAKLRGLTYSLEDGERVYHDPWQQTLDGHHNWPRLGLVREPQRISRRKARPKDEPEDIVIYELHVGSLLGEAGNLHISTFEDVAGKLGDLKRLGFNALALMPTNATEGARDWGYLGTSSFAHQESYAATGSDAELSLIKFMERAHSLGFRVFADVVYNHIGGFHNDLWEFDGLENSWFERNSVVKATEGTIPLKPYDTTEGKPRTVSPSVRNTPWGPIPAFTKQVVRQFFIDHALDQLDRFGFDGIRFDFTHLIHAAGSGGHEGWEMLRAMHRRIRYFYPHALTFAEEFPPHPIITQPVDDGGAGFTGMWNTEHQHRLIFDHHRPSVTQCLVREQDPPLDHFIQHLIVPEGFADPLRSATVLSNHDEVGNARRLYHIVKDHPRGFDIARLVSWFSLLCPGYALIFQGTEDLAANYFSWGIPHTWDVDSHLRGGKLAPYRKRHLNAIKDVLNLRKNEPDLWAHSPIVEFYRDTYHHVLGIRRGRFWIVGNFGKPSQDVPERLTRGGELVLNSERPSYDYRGRTTRGSRIGSYALKVWMRE